MTEQSSALKFLLWAAGIGLACSGTVSLKKAAHKTAKAAIDAQSQQSLPWEHYSKVLWSSTKPGKPLRVPSPSRPTKIQLK